MSRDVDSFCFHQQTDSNVTIEARKLDVKVVKFTDDTKGGKVITGIEDRDKLQQALDCYR